MAAGRAGEIALHQHFRLDDRHNTGLLAERGIAGQGVGVGLDAASIPARTSRKRISSPSPPPAERVPYCSVPPYGDDRESDGRESDSWYIGIAAPSFSSRATTTTAKTGISPAIRLDGAGASHCLGRNENRCYHPCQSSLRLHHSTATVALSMKSQSSPMPIPGPLGMWV